MCVCAYVSPVPFDVKKLYSTRVLDASSPSDGAFATRRKLARRGEMAVEVRGLVIMAPASGSQHNHNTTEYADWHGHFAIAGRISAEGPDPTENE
jgi:hypothetical protein